MARYADRAPIVFVRSFNVEFRGNMLKPPTPEQIDLYDVCEEDGDLFHVTNTVHVQCQRREGDLYVHNIEIDPAVRRTGQARETLAGIRAAYPDLHVVANGVEWHEDAGRFWRAMVLEGLVDTVVTYQDGNITLVDIEQGAPRP